MRFALILLVFTPILINGMVVFNLLSTEKFL